jgi:hypothetical protein
VRAVSTPWKTPAVSTNGTRVRSRSTGSAPVMLIGSLIRVIVIWMVIIGMKVIWTIVIAVIVIRMIVIMMVITAVIIRVIVIVTIIIAMRPVTTIVNLLNVGLDHRLGEGRR